MTNPSREEQLEAIRMKVIAEVPEIMELKFGCKLLTKKYSWEGTVETLTWANEGLDEYELAFREKHITHVDIVEVLGRPIHLADILLAWKANRDLDGKALATLDRIVFLYNLHKDDLREQPIETINFIFTLLQ